MYIYIYTYIYRKSPCQREREESSLFDFGRPNTGTPDGVLVASCFLLKRGYPNKGNHASTVPSRLGDSLQWSPTASICLGGLPLPMLYVPISDLLSRCNQCSCFIISCLFQATQVPRCRSVISFRGDQFQLLYRKFLKRGRAFERVRFRVTCCFAGARFYGISVSDVSRAGRHVANPGDMTCKLVVKSSSYLVRLVLRGSSGWLVCSLSLSLSLAFFVLSLSLSPSLSLSLLCASLFVVFVPLSLPRPLKLSLHVSIYVCNITLSL